MDYGMLKKINEINKIKINDYNKLYGFLFYDDSNKSASFKITDIAQKGEKKSVKGFKCITSSIQTIKKNINRLNPKIFNKDTTYQKHILCNDFEALLKEKDLSDDKKWYYIAEHYSILMS